MELKKYKLGELMEVTRGMSLCGDYYATEGDLMRLTLGNFDYRNNCFKDDKSKDNLYFSGDVKTEFILNKGDIITPLTEQAIGLLGSTAKVPYSNKYIQSQDVGLIKCNDKLNPDFAFYLIPSKLVRTQLSAAAQQTKIRHTSPDKIKNCTVWIPDYSTQEKIGKLLSALDDKISLNRRMNAKLEAMAKRLYDYWFVQFDFPNENGKPYKSSGGKMEYNEDLKREIPAGWEVKRVEDFCRIFTGKKDVNQSLESGKYKFFSCAPDFKFSNEKIYEGKAILISGNGSYTGRTIFVNDAFDLYQRTYAVVLKEANYNCLEYIFFTAKRFLTLKVGGGTHGSAIPYIVYNDIAKESFAFSETIIEKFEEIIIPILSEITAKEKEIQKLTALRDKLLPLLINGQVEVK